MGKSIKLTLEQEQQIIYNYTVLKQGQKKAGAFIPVSDHIVKKVLNKYNIPIKTLQETNANKYYINHDFFKVQNEDMAYWLGILGSDGCISSMENQIYIELQRQDKELLEKLNAIIENQRPVKDYETARGYENSKLYFYSKEIKNDLAQYHIIPNKTYNPEYRFPEKLKFQYIKDYIRGLFDGDGSIKQGTSITWQVDTGSYDIAKKIVEFFAKYDIELQISFLSKKNVTIYRVYGYTKQKVQKIYNLLYNTQSTLYLKRKKEKFEELLK